MTLSRSLSITTIAISGGNVMAEEMKKIDKDELEKVDGGAFVASYQTLRRDLKEMIPDEVREKLKNASGDVDTCRILAENGVDVEKIEKKIEDAGLKVKKIGFQELADEALSNVAGGWKRYGAEIRCACGNDDYEEFSYQFWASSFCFGPSWKYRCKKCNRYMKITVEYENEPAKIEYY